MPKIDDAHKSALSYVVGAQFMWFLLGKHPRKIQPWITVSYIATYHRSKAEYPLLQAR